MDSVAAATIILLHGLSIGMVLYIISIGMSVTLGLMRFINLAHGVFAMFGGYVALTLMNSYGFGFALALLAAALVPALIGVLLERTFYSFLYEKDELSQVLFTIGMVFIAVAVARYAFGPLPLPVKLPSALSGNVEIVGREFPTYRLFIIIISFILVSSLWLLWTQTRFGMQLRAAVDNRKMSESMGINTGILFTATFAIGSGLAGLGGALGAAFFAISPGYPKENLIYFLIVAAIGAIGRRQMSFVVALTLGIGDTVCKYLLPEFGAFFIFAFVIAWTFYFGLRYGAPTKRSKALG